MSSSTPASQTTFRSEAAHGEPIRANAWGRFYVTAECDGCGACAACAPDNIGMTFDGTCYGVMHQPVDEDEEAALRTAMFACPRHCIHDDGESD